MKIKINEIIVPASCRTSLDNLQLKKHIFDTGMKHPIQVTLDSSGYHLTEGQCRLHCAKLFNLEEISADILMSQAYYDVNIVTLAAKGICRYILDGNDLLFQHEANS